MPAPMIMIRSDGNGYSPKKAAALDQVEKRLGYGSSTPCAGIIRIRFKGYVLSSAGEHPCVVIEIR